MIKIFCDRCGKEIDDVVNTIEGEKTVAKDNNGNKLIEFGASQYHLCDKCNEVFQISQLGISDFIRLSDKELDLLYCAFHIGDEVITSTGEVGTITYICTCDFCKESGFYEPQVKTLLGTRTIYITDNDKKNNFRNFYKIGRNMFGNLDRDSIEYDVARVKERLEDLYNELEIYNQQLNNVKHFENKKTEQQL